MNFTIFSTAKLIYKRATENNNEMLNICKLNGKHLYAASLEIKTLSTYVCKLN